MMIKPTQGEPVHEFAAADMIIMQNRTAFLRHSALIA
jgi:hypothetical protein